MGLFRSEEHVRNWSDFQPDSEESIMPLRDWAECMATPACRTRLQPDTLERQVTYGTELLEMLDHFGRNGERWRPR